jgi:hypothetical protein
MSLPYRRFGPPVLAALLPLIAAVGARADDMWLGSDVGLGEALRPVLTAAVILPLLVISTVLIETLVIGKCLKLAAEQAFGAALVINVISGGFSLLLWFVLGPEGGWKTAILMHHYARVVGYMVRSYLITLSIETPFLLLFVRHMKLDPMAVVRASALANASSYGFTLFFLLLASARVTL